MKRLFITGGTGFFGKSILSMLKRGAPGAFEVTILARDAARFLRECPEFAAMPRLHFIAGDVRDFDFPAGHFDWVLHAATPAVTGLAPGVMRSVIIEGTRRVLEFARFCGAEKFLLTGSGAVYGIQEPECGHITEDHPCAPVTEYGIAKLEAEKMCLDSGLPVLLPRCFAFTGPYLNRDIHFAIGNFIRDALAGKTIRISGDGTPLRSYMFSDDLVRWLFAMLDHAPCGVPCNVGSDVEISIAALAERVKTVLNSSAEIEICQTPQPGAKAARYVPSIARARSWGLELNYTLDEAIRSSLKECEIIP